MRYTSENPEHIGVTVYLDGSEIKYVTECDTSEGWIIRLVRSDDGQFTLNGDDVATEKLTGAVTVCPSSPPITFEG